MKGETGRGGRGGRDSREGRKRGMEGNFALRLFL